MTQVAAGGGGWRQVAAGRGGWRLVAAGRGGWRRVVAVVWVVCAGSALHAQAPVPGSSIETLVARAVDGAPAIAAARARVDAAEGEKRQAGLRPNPIAAADRREQFGGIEAQTSIGVTVPLDLFRRDARVAVADRDVQMAALMVDEAALDRAWMVRTRAARVLSAIRQLEVVDRVAQAARSRLDLLAARVDSGAGRPLDRDLADVEWRRVEADRLRWQGEVDAAWADLQAAVGVPMTDRVALALSLEAEAAVLPPVPDTPVVDSVSRRPDVQALEQRGAQADAARDLARREGKWDLSVTGAYMWRTVGMPEARERMNEVMVGVMVDLPWRNRQQGAIAAAEAAGRAARSELAGRRLDAEAEVAAARARDVAATAMVRRYQDGLLTLADRNLSVVRESWTLGDATLFDVIEEERRYLALQADYTSALRDLIEARAMVRRAMGVR